LVVALAVAPRVRAQTPPTQREAMIERVDSSLVRIVAVAGAAAAWSVPDDRALGQGPDAVVATSFGTGFAVRAHLVLTARHVVAGSQFVLVVPTGTTEGVAARVVYADAVADVASLAVDAALPHVVPLPANVQAPRPGAELWVSGYPVDP